MTKKEQKLIIAGVLVVLIIASIGYYLSSTTRDGNGGDHPEIVQNQEKYSIEEIYLYNQDSDEGADLAVSEFNPGDYLGLYLEYVANEEVSLNTNMLDRSENIEIESPLPTYELTPSGEIRSRTVVMFRVPSRENLYYIEVSIDGEVVEVLPFEVTQN